MPAQISENNLPLNSLTILEAHNGIVVLNVNHKDETSDVGNVYFSDYTGTKFSLSLWDTSRDEHGCVDFIKIKSLEGVYIANHIYKNDKISLITHN